MDKVKEIILTIAVIFVGGCAIYGTQAQLCVIAEKYLGPLGSGTQKLIAFVTLALVVWTGWYLYKRGREKAEKDFEKERDNLLSNYKGKNDGTAD